MSTTNPDPDAAPELDPPDLDPVPGAEPGEDVEPPDLRAPTTAAPRVAVPA